MKARSLYLKIVLVALALTASLWAQDGLEGALSRANLASPANLGMPFSQTLGAADFDGDNKPDGAVFIDHGRLWSQSSFRTIELHLTGHGNTNLITCTNTIKGRVAGIRMRRTPDERLYSSGSRDACYWTQCFVSLGDPDAEDFMRRRDTNLANGGHHPDQQLGRLGARFYPGQRGRYPDDYRRQAINELPRQLPPSTASGQDLFGFTLFNQPDYLNLYNAQHGTGTLTALPYNSWYKCYDGMHNWNQLRPAPYDGI